MGVLLKFYLSCLLASWGDRLWFFALSIYLVTINSNTLLVTAINGLACNLTSIIISGYIGSLIDKYQRISVVRLTLFIQNTTVACSCIIVVLIVVNKKFFETGWNGSLLYVAQSFIILFNVISDSASNATKIAIERDWVIVIAKHLFYQNHQKLKNENENNEDEENNTENANNVDKEDGLGENLANINAVVRRIDLCTSIIAPLVAGVIMSFFKINPTYNGVVVSAMFFAAWNLVSYGIEYFLMKSIYDDVPDLKKPVSINKQKKDSIKFSKRVKKFFDGWPIYMQQGLLIMPGLCLATLYLTVLSFDSITIGYAKSQHLTEIAIGLFQGIGSISGVLGTIGFQVLHNKLKLFLPVVGLIGSIYQLIFLLCCFISIWLPGSPFILAKSFLTTNQTSDCQLSLNSEHLKKNSTLFEFINSTNISLDKFVVSKKFDSYLFEDECAIYKSILLLLFAMSLSRFGLWLLDLSIHQIIQQSVPEKKRGVIGGVQNSLNQIFELIKFALVILFSDVSNYGYLVMTSVSAIFIALCLYTTFTIIQIVRKSKKKSLNQIDSTPDPNNLEMQNLKVANDDDGDADEKISKNIN